MTIEQDGTTVTTNNLYYEQIAQEFLKALNEDPNKLYETLKELNKGNKTEIFLRS
jgi:hypothetical protein